MIYPDAFAGFDSEAGEPVEPTKRENGRLSDAFMRDMSHGNSKLAKESEPAMGINKKAGGFKFRPIIFCIKSVLVFALSPECFKVKCKCEAQCIVEGVALIG